MNKKLILIGILFIAVALFTSGCIQQTGIGDDGQRTVDEECDATQAVSINYDDKDEFEIGTDPGRSLWVYEKNGERFTANITDDSSGLSFATQSNFKGVAGLTWTGVNNITSQNYFKKLVEFSTVCSDVDVQVNLGNAVKPTSWSIVNDNGVSKNGNETGTNETTTASSTYTQTHSIRAPSKDCSAYYGAIVACEYNSSLVSKLEPVNGIESTSETIFEVFADATNSRSGYGGANMTGFNQWKVFKWTGNNNGKLCDGAKTEFSLKMTTSATSPDTTIGHNHDYQCHWMPLDYDIHASNGEVILGIYDEDNNAIYTAGGMNQTFWTTS